MSRTSSRQLCTFEVGGLSLGVDVLRVQEVLRHRKVRPVPLASPSVRGLINLRGRIVLAIDLRRGLDLEDFEAVGVEAPMNVVLWNDDGPFSVLVDRIHDIVDLDGIASEPPPPHLSAPTRRLARAAHAFPDHLLLELDPDAVIGLAFDGSSG